MIQRNISLLRALPVDAALLRLRDAVIAEATHRTPLWNRTKMRSKRVVQRPLPFRLPHQPIDVVIRHPVRHHRRQQRTRLRIVETRIAPQPAIHIDLAHLLEVRHQPRVIRLLKQRVRLHSLGLRLRNQIRKNVKLPQLRRANIFDDRTLVELRMNLRITTAVNPVILLHPMIGKRLTAHLSPRKPRAVGEHGRHHYVDTALLPQRVETLIHTLIHKRPRTNLDRHKPLPRRRKRRRSTLPLRGSHSTTLRLFHRLRQKPISSSKRCHRGRCQALQKLPAGVVLETLNWFAHQNSPEMECPMISRNPKLYTFEIPHPYARSCTFRSSTAVIGGRPWLRNYTLAFNLSAGWSATTSTRS